MTNQLGEITRDTNMNLILEKGEWRVQWEEGMILPELRGGRQLLLEYKIPARGDIYASNGYPLAITTDAIGIGIVPASFRDGGESGTLSEVSRLTEIPSAWIKSLYGDNYTDQFIPVGETLASTFNRGKADALPGSPGSLTADATTDPVSRRMWSVMCSIFKEERPTSARTIAAMSGWANAG